MMIIYVLACFIAAVLLLLQIYDFNPTRFYISNLLGLYKISKRFDCIDDISQGEVETLLHFLILYKTTDKDEVIQEVRNGYVLKFYPEDVDVNRRVFPMAYVEIHDDETGAVLYVGFDENEIPRYQIKRKTYLQSLLQLFRVSKQGTEQDFYHTKQDKQIILNRYRDYVVKHVL